jgi:hypothetical protein
MSENNLISPPADTLGLSFYSCFLNLTSPGTYNLYVYFTDLGGEPVVTASDTFIVETYDPASGAKLGLNGSQFELLSNSYSQPLKLSLFTINGNASADGSQSFLSDGVYYLAPPVTERTAIGPAYLLQPGVMLDEPASVILPYGDYIGGFSPGALGVYLYRDGGWVYLDDPNINPENQTISVRTKQLGLFQVQAGPHDPTPADLLIPDHYALKQNYPNPFNPQTRIDYQLPHAGETTLKIYNIRGQEIATLVDGFQNTGFYSVTWNGTANGGIPVASGIYLFRLHSGNFSRTHKMILLK